jgi:hypothetical protein
MKGSRKRIALSLFTVVAVIIYFAAPFPLASYIAKHPRWDDQLGGGVPSKIFHTLYNPWIGHLSGYNAYKQLFNEHMNKLCLENPEFCANETPQKP